MSSTLPADKLQLLSELITRQTGIDLPPHRAKDLEGALLAITREFGFADLHVCVEWLLSGNLSKKQVKVLARYITIGETYFYRDSDFFTTLQRELLPEIIEARQVSGRYLRIWSAACCTGEEVYSVAILLKEMIPDLNQWDISLMGTDINVNFIKKARQGVYRPWSFRNTPAWFMKYFSKTTEGNYRISAEIRNMVRFSFLNLAEDSYPAPENNTKELDMVLCRNALMYFPRSKAQQVVGKFYQSLDRQGWLALSACESSFPYGSKFAPVFFDKTTLFRKGSVGPRLISRHTPIFTPLAAIQQDIGQPPFAIVPGGEQVEAVMPFAEPPQTPEPVAAIAPPPDGDHYVEARADYEQGRYRDAEAKLSRLAGSQVTGAGADQARSTMVLLLLSRICANQGKIEAALEWCEQLVAADKLNPAVYFLRATILMEKGDLEKSVPALRQALYLDPDFTLAHFLLGNQMRVLGKDKSARGHFNNALVLLDTVADHEILPESEGISAGSLRHIIKSTLGSFA